MDDDVAGGEDAREDPASRSTGRISLVVTLLVASVVVAVIFFRGKRRAARDRQRSPVGAADALVEILAGAGDSIASFQDAIAGEAYVASASAPASRGRRRLRGKDGCRERVYQTSADSAQGDTVQFGDGVSGAVPPPEGDVASGGYRRGAGAAGDIPNQVYDDLAYSGIWERAVCAAEVPGLRAVAVGCPDTSVRWLRRGGGRFAGDGLAESRR